MTCGPSFISRGHIPSFLLDRDDIEFSALKPDPDTKIAEIITADVRVAGATANLKSGADQTFVVWLEGKTKAVRPCYRCPACIKRPKVSPVNRCNGKTKKRSHSRRVAVL